MSGRQLAERNKPNKAAVFNPGVAARRGGWLRRGAGELARASKPLQRI